jgi:hypothetical protein
MKNKMLQASVAVAMLGGLVVVAVAGPLAGHPHLKAARNSINRALSDCRAARADEKHGEFGGHRDKAEQLLNEAKGELDAAAEFANAHP